MNWLRTLFSLGRDPGERERKEREVAALEVKSEATLGRVDRALAERQRIIATTRKTVAALQRRAP